MVPRLYKSSETAFTSEGLGRLTDARKCEVTEERNGQYELLLEYPVTGKLMPELTMGRIIWAIHDDSKTGQPFQIYEISRPLQGWVKVRAWHISYALNFVVCKPFTATSTYDAMDKIPANIMGTAPYTFTFSTNLMKVATLTVDVPKTVRSLLGGSRGSMIDTYGGELTFDKFNVNLGTRGSNNGVVIKYGKNLTKLDRELNRQNSYNSIVPYWTDGEEIVASSQVVVKPFQTQGNTVVMDASADFEEKPSRAQLRNWARAKLVATDTTKAKDNIKISFVELWQTEEYKHIANLERVRLCDTVTIDYEKGGVQVPAKCIRVVYDALLERYVSMELGEPQTTLSQQIQEDTEAAILPQVPNKTAMQGAIDRATELITGGFGGYIKYKYLQDGTPSEMLIMDTASEATATNIIRLNQNGLGFSTDGGATYANAWTIDGHLNADFITTGTLIASLIKTGLLQDQSGKNYWNLDTGQFVTKQGTIGGFTIGDTRLSSDNAVISPNGISFYSGFADGDKSIQFSTTSLISMINHAGSWKNGFIMTADRDGNGYNYARIQAGEASKDNLYLYDNDDASRNIHNAFIGGLRIKGDAQVDQHLYTNISFSSSVPASVDVPTTGYWSAVIVGFVQNVSSVIIGLTCDGGTLTAKNLMTGGAWSNAALSFSTGSDAYGAWLTISSNQAATSNVSLFIG